MQEHKKKQEICFFFIVRHLECTPKKGAKKTATKMAQ